MDDKKILDLLWQRSEQAIEALTERFGALLHRICMNILGDPLDAQECVSDTYLAVWNAIPPKKPNPLSPFVCRTGKNIALNRLRSNTAKKRKFCPLLFADYCHVTALNKVTAYNASNSITKCFGVVN